MRGKNYDERDELVKTIRGVQRCEEERRYPIEQGVSHFMVWIQVMKKHRMLRSTSVIFYIV